MLKLNKNYEKLVENYLFHEVATKVSAYQKNNPDKRVIKLGIGDVTEPLAPCVVDALKRASEEMGNRDTFKGYGDYEGYLFLREAISNYYKTNIGANVEPDEIFVSEGAKSDTANFQELFDIKNNVVITDPVYPVYYDSNIMQGRRITTIAGTKENGFCPMPDKKIKKSSIIYLCSPNNPTGAAYTEDQLEGWVNYALATDSIILFDAAYEAFIEDPNIPRSIFQIDGAKECAVEFCSLSKTAGFTGTRCGYTVIPKELKVGDKYLSKMWLRRQSTKFNGTSYIVQRGAEAVFSNDGIEQTRASIKKYKENAKIITSVFDEIGIWYAGGKNSPYVWLECKMPSWEFFDKLLNNASVVGTPGVGFGKMGEGFFRLTSFNTKENTIEAMDRIKKLF